MENDEMLEEYRSLRAEVLQVYEQQMSLVFGASITAAAALLATLANSPAIVVALPVLLSVLIGVCNKSIANYSRIYRIGAYIAVVHEQRGQPAERFKPGPARAAYHVTAGGGEVDVVGGRRSASA